MAYVAIYIDYIGPKISVRYGDAVDFAVVTGTAIVLAGIGFWVKRRTKITPSKSGGN
jgi:hypothetical protein